MLLHTQGFMGILGSHWLLLFINHVRLSIRRGFRAFAGECMEGMAWNLHADVSWPSSQLISIWPWSVDFPNFGTILT